MAGFSGLGLGELGAESKYVGNTGDFYAPKMGENETSILEGLRKTGLKYAADNWLKPASQWMGQKTGIAPSIDNDYLAQQYGMYRSAPPKTPFNPSITVNEVTGDLHPELDSTMQSFQF